MSEPMIIIGDESDRNPLIKPQYQERRDLRKAIQKLRDEKRALTRRMNNELNGELKELAVKPEEKESFKAVPPTPKAARKAKRAIKKMKMVPGVDVGVASQEGAREALARPKKEIKVRAKGGAPSVGKTVIGAKEVAKGVGRAGKRTAMAVTKGLTTRQLKKQHAHEVQMQGLNTLETILSNPDAFLFLLSTVAGAGIAWPMEVHLELDTIKNEVQEHGHYTERKMGPDGRLATWFYHRFYGDYTFQPVNVGNQVQQKVPFLGHLVVPLPQTFTIHIDTGRKEAFSPADAAAQCRTHILDAGLNHARAVYPPMGLAIGAIMSAALYAATRSLDIKSIELGNLPSLEISVL